MRNFQKRGKLKNIMQSTPFLIFLGFFIVIFFFSIFNFMNKMEETRKNRETVEQKIKELEESKEKLDLKILKLNTERGVEENIREKFGLAKEGENMILVVEEIEPEIVEKKIESSGFWSFLRNLFK
ncbi:MAG: hypothetical protein UR25_C0002G0008 [Candidatus Nomurabacteria bacterium GW2011_GWE1_32_28]|uniref:Septum formation initiator n=1 Tax=Candidatus Nomurabacteria bacterium GW2011_GWF1_31_48 TaxID=1618767 RepID=A0A0G0BHG6_9BACT|nr:MAG: hypothetical protein UR10_C0002G0008 [Candidatus Nomurabacteria bacterium GW2011_GWF2_30_133]KKP29103.1 MAG: hypothetical protein UR18_C0001G0224 [Candidatus Nomurabacteria bacterium GW2011_GWE2_31_40]KKP30487.1 MAG: hypothetical protein UR19_C0002G0008 [Candidatus Nomurabacteria bacterium GW2011_GWF1_31_48]KKP34972.1 MAG: hypothetical protein UR25_C0002G0008 [Candidatus Nomurabacteria bacterium GW2011_GWE1_32_28]HAS80660.1 hypothetical protein [Candidatus Nomurabacteria bacterium]